MSRDFKPGDRIIATIDSPILKKGKVYTVESLNAANGNVIIFGIYDDGTTPTSGVSPCNFDPYTEPAPVGGPIIDRSRTGAKDDGGKLDVTLLFDDMPNALYEVTKVLQWAITEKKPVPYERGSWQSVPDFQRRYRAAQLRHELNAAISRIDNPGAHPVDAETGLNELAHIATSALFRLEMMARDIKKGGQVWLQDSSVE